MFRHHLVKMIVTILIMLFMQTGSIAYASDSNVLILNQAVDLALLYHPEIKKFKTDLELARVNKNNAENAYETARANYTQNLNVLRNAVENAETGYDLARYVYEDGQISLEKLNIKIVFNMEKDYLTLLNLNNIIRSVEKNYSIQKQTANIEELKKDLGLSTLYLVDQQREKIYSIDRQLQDLYNTRQTLSWQINRNVGRDINSPLVLAPVTFERVNYEENKQASLAAASGESLAISQFNRTIEDKKIEADNKQITASDKLEKIELEIQQTTINKDNVEYGMRVAVENAYTKMGNASKSLVDKNQSWEIARRNYENQQLQYQLGMTSKVNYDVMEINYQQKQSEYEQAVYDYYLAARAVKLLEQGVII